MSNPERGALILGALILGALILVALDDHTELCAGGIGHKTHDALRRQFSGGNTDLTLASFTKMLIDNKKPVSARHRVELFSFGHAGLGGPRN